MSVHIENQKNNYIIVRSLTTRSLLPQNSYLSKDASYVSRKEIAFCATRVTAINEYYELGWAHPKEIALFSSVIIGAHPGYGKVFIYPVRWPFCIDDYGQDLSDLNYIEQLGEEIKRKIGVSIDSNEQQNPWEDLPPVFTNSPYEFNNNVKLNNDYKNHLFESINCENDLLIRGLSHLIKTGMLTRLGRMFFDTACLELYVALEATLHIILERLKDFGMNNPSNKDASDYILEQFGESYRLDRYYQDFYDDRIKAIHPNSRFGTAKFVPLYTDDLYILYDDLLRNFEFLITNKPNNYENYYQAFPNETINLTEPGDKMPPGRLSLGTDKI
jgi:hypothetical protein